MVVFNWIHTRFADGANFVSDAPDEVAEAVARVLETQPQAPAAGCDFGTLELRTSAGVFACSYLRLAATSVGTAYVHAVLATAVSAEPSLASVQSLFEERYGAPPEPRVQELVARLAVLPVSQATLPLTDLFIESAALERWLEPARRPARPRATPRLDTGAALPWLVAVAMAAAAGFFAGRGAPTPPLAPVGAAPPAVDLAQRVERLEGDLGAVGMPLQAQLAHERRLHREALAEKDRALRELEARLSAPPVRLVTPSRVEAFDAAAPAKTAAASVPPPPPAPSPPSQAPVAVPAEPGSHAIVVADRLWVRSGPGVEYPRFARLREGTAVALESRTPDGGWVRIATPEEGWVAAEFLDMLAFDAQAEGGSVVSPSAATPDGRIEADAPVGVEAHAPVETDLWVEAEAWVGE